MRQFPVADARPRAGHPSWVDVLLSACLAPTCAVCDGWLRTPTRGAVCETCWSAVQIFTPPLCAVCGAPLARSTRAEGTGGACGLCASAPLRFVDRAAALGLHDGTLRHVVHALKFGRRHGLAVRLACLLRAAHGDLIEAADAVVPVPLHPRRRRSRGFNQAHELARHLGRPVLVALHRTRHTPPQTALTAHARQVNVERAFAVARAAQGRPARRRPWGWWTGAGQPCRGVEGRRLLLVDDVWTTGATLSACARVLKEAGAREVWAIVIARAVPSRLR